MRKMVVRLVPLHGGFDGLSERTALYLSSEMRRWGAQPGKSSASGVILFLVKTYGYACLQPKEIAMSVQLLIVYPPPNDPAKFDRAYREEHLPYAGPRLLGATGVTTKRVLGAPRGAPFAHTISFVEFPTAEIAKTCAQSKGGQEALAHAASISTGGPPQFLLVEDAS
jgi:hypothetical protein